MATTLKQLEFDNEKLNVVWAALAFLPEGHGRSLSPEKRREEGKLFRKLKQKTEEVRKPFGDNRVFITRTIKEGETTIIELEQHEIELIRTRIDEYPFYQPAASDIVSDVWDWLGTGKNIEKV